MHVRVHTHADPHAREALQDEADDWIPDDDSGIEW